MISAKSAKSISQNHRKGKRNITRPLNPFPQTRVVFGGMLTIGRRRTSPYWWFEEDDYTKIGRLTPLITESTTGWGPLLTSNVAREKADLQPRPLLVPSRAWKPSSLIRFSYTISLGRVYPLFRLFRRVTVTLAVRNERERKREGERWCFLSARRVTAPRRP